MYTIVTNLDLFVHHITHDNRRSTMPKVGGKSYSYTKSGMAAAKKAAKKTGKKVSYSKPTKMKKKKK